MTQYTIKPNAVGRARVLTAQGGTPAPPSPTPRGTPTFGGGAAGSPAVTTGPVQGTFVATGGSANLVTNVNDASDASYVRKTSVVATDFYTWNLGTFTLPATEVVSRFKWRVRMKRPLSTSKFTAFFFTGGGGSTYVVDTVYGTASAAGVANTIAWEEGPWVALPNLATNEFTQFAIDDLNLVVVDSATTSASATYLYEVEILVETTVRPKVNITSQGQAYNVITRSLTTNVVTLTTDVAHNIASGTSVTVTDIDSIFNGTYTLTGVTATTMTYAKVNANVGSTATTGFVRAGYVVTNTTRPLISWSVTDADADSQNGVEVYVYTEAQVTAAGAAFSPGSTTALWSYSSLKEGIVDSSAARYVGVSLSQGGSYRAYIRVYTFPSAVGSYPSSSGGAQSLWNYLLFSVNAAIPPTAQVNVTPDTTLQANRVVGTARINLLTANQSTLETGATTGIVAGNANSTLGVATGGLQKSGTYCLSVTAAAASDVFFVAGSNGDTSHLVAVTPGQSYCGTVQVRTAVTARSAAAFINWYDSSFTPLASVFGTGSNDSTSYGVRTVTAVAPAAAAYAATGAYWTAAAISEVHYADEIALHPGTTAAYSPGGANTCQVAINAFGVGQLLTTTTMALTATSTTTPVIRSAARSKSGLSQRVRATGAVTASTSTGVGGIPMVAGAPVTFSAKMTSEAATTLTMTLVPYDATGAALTTSAVAQAVSIGVMLEFTGTYTLPANTAFVALQFSTTVANDFYVDEMFLSYGTTTPALAGFSPARVRQRTFALNIADCLFDYVDEGAPADNTPTVYTFDSIVDGGANASGIVGAVATINSTAVWSMRVLAYPERNLYSIKARGPLDENRNEQVEAHWTLDSDYPTVLSGALGGVDGTLKIRTDTDTEWRAITEALNSQSTIVLHPNYAQPGRGAEPRFIRVMKQDWDVEKYGARVMREVTVGFIETKPF